MVIWLCCWTRLSDGLFISLVPFADAYTKRVLHWLHVTNYCCALLTKTWWRCPHNSLKVVFFYFQTHLKDSWFWWMRFSSSFLVKSFKVIFIYTVVYQRKKKFKVNSVMIFCFLFICPFFYPLAHAQTKALKHTKGRLFLSKQNRSLSESKSESGFGVKKADYVGL